MPADPVYRFAEAIQTGPSAPVIEQTGNGLTVISTFNGGPVHPFAVAVTVYLTTPAVVPVLVNACAMIFPHAAEQLLNPVIVPPDGIVKIAAVQVNVVPATLLVNVIDGAFPEQTVWDTGVAVTAGRGFTDISTVTGVPGHPLADGVTVYLTTPAVVPELFNICAILVPQAELQLLKPVIVPPEGKV
jgi:hypothetical protein